METTKITVQGTINSDVPKAWNCWTLPEHITQWNFANDDWHCPKAENDLRAGGKYLARMEAKDGSFGFDFEAIYDEVVNQKSITYTMLDGRQATTVFEDRDGQTGVTVTFDAETQNSIDLQRDGWQAILDNYIRYVEKQ